MIMLLIAALITVCVLRWEAWFSNPAENTYIVPAEPDNIIVGFGRNCFSRTVSWRSCKQLPSFAVIDGDTILTDGSKVVSRAGEAFYYRAEKDSLSAGVHSYFVQTGELRSEDYTFYVSDDDSLRLFVFGDIQEKDTLSPFYEFCDSVIYNLCRLQDMPAMFAYCGDVIDRPTDYAWQTWFTSLRGLQTLIPQVAAVGNHEYLKGINSDCDPRWPYIFSYPDNNAERFSGTTGYIDYPTLRLVVLNTQELFWLSDYTIAQTWLNKVLSEAEKKFTVVLMHHSVFSAAMKRSNPLIYATFRHTLKKADLVIAGHDHLYTRRAKVNTYLLEDSVSYSTPVFIVTSSSSKHYIPRISADDQRIGSTASFVEDITVSNGVMKIKTREMTTGSVYDEFVIYKENNEVLISDSLPEEHILLPERYKDVNNLYVRRFYNRSKARQEN